MASPHRNDPDYAAAPHPNDGEKLAVEQRYRFPPILLRSRCWLMDHGPAIEKLEGIRKIKVALLQDSLAFFLVPFEFHDGDF